MKDLLIVLLVISLFFNAVQYWLGHYTEIANEELKNEKYSMSVKLYDCHQDVFNLMSEAEQQ